MRREALREVGAGGVPPLGIAASAALFGAGALLVLFAMRVATPALAAGWKAEPVVVWFAAAAGCLFLPLVLIGGWLLYRETGSVWPRNWGGRLRFRSLGARAWGVVAAALLVVGLTTAALMLALRWAGVAGLAPPAMAIEPLTPDRYWVLLAWLPFFVLNIAGEEVVWRGIVLPRQEAAFGRHAWWLHGAGWLFVHAAFPWPVLVLLLPTVLVLPWTVQRLGNSWAGVVLHAALNGPGFLAHALGLA